MRRRGSLLIVLLALVLVAISVGLAFRGWGFYRMSAEDRVDHSDFRQLRASGMVGNGYGWVAALLIVLNLAYLIRRRFGGPGLGKMQTWLDVHVFTGLTAATLVSFHSAFQLRTPIATLSTSSLLLVVGTGLVGRFLYSLAPVGASERFAAALDAIELAMPGGRAALAEVLAKQPGPVVPQNASLVRSVLAIPAWRRAGRARRAIVDSMLPRARLSARARSATHELRIAATIEARASGVAALLRSWRGLHRLFALLMLAAVLLHACVAWYYGYRWIFA